jgi:phosphate-selective porin OprO/OprP
MVFVGVARAQVAAEPTNAELLRRIQELEATVTTLKAPGQGSPQAGSDSPAPGLGDQGTVDGSGSAAAGPGRPTRMEQRRSGEIQPDPPPGGLPPGQVAGWGNGFFIQSPDQKFVANFTGQVQTDSRWFLNANDKTDIDEFILRRARIGLEAIMFDYYEFRFLSDFSGSNLNAPAPPSTPTPSIVDAYGNIHYFDEAQFLGGRFKQPFSYEQLITDRYTPFLERSLIDQLVPQRDIGLMIHGQNLLEGCFEYYLAVSDGQINGNFDSTNNKDFVGRVVVHPFAPYEDSYLRYLTLGLSSTFGEVRQTPLQVSPSNSFPQVLRTPLGVPWLTFNSASTANGDRTRFSPEVQYFVGPFAIASQYYIHNQEVSPAASGLAGTRQINVFFHGYYVMTTLLLTGEERTGFSRGANPRRPFDLRNPFANPGMWELSARVSQLHASDNIFLAGTSNLASPTTNANGCTEMTLGFNWYLNRGMLMRFNWERAWFNRPVVLGSGPAGFLSRQDAIGVRFELTF